MGFEINLLAYATGTLVIAGIAGILAVLTALLSVAFHISEIIRLRRKGCYTPGRDELFDNLLEIPAPYAVFALLVLMHPIALGWIAWKLLQRKRSQLQAVQHA